MRRSVVLLACSTLFVNPLAHAVDLSVSGVVNKSLMVYDDGSDTEFTVADNNLGSTSFTFEGEHTMENGLTASFMKVINLISNSSNELTQNESTTQSSTASNISGALSESTSRVGLAGKFGAVFLGFQPTAIDDAYYHDLAGAADVMNQGFASHGAGLVFNNSVTGVSTTLGGEAASIGALAFGKDGGAEEENALAYNTPTFNGFELGLSTSQGGDVDTNLRYAKGYKNFETEAAFGIGFENSGDTGTDAAERTYNASLSTQYNNGTAWTVAYFSQELERKTAGNAEPEGYYAKVSHSFDKFELAADYAKVKNAVVADTTEHALSSVGLAGQCNIADGVSAAVLYRNYSADITGTPTDDIDVFALNLQVAF